MALAAGTCVGTYEIVAPIGSGGMGEVYKARDPRLNRFVALKVLSTGLAADTDRKQRFIQEARAASALNHPNIITIHDISVGDGRDYLVMEYLSGQTIQQLISRKELSLKDTLKYAVQTAEALAAAHSAGIVHREVKPSNIMVTHDGRLKLLDFGLAKLAEPSEIGPEQRTVTMLARTEVGTIMGSAPYMSPEQVQGKPVDARSDIFSFGVTLYEMVTGQRPFQGDTLASIIASILRDEPKPPGALAEGLPRALERIILRCLYKDLDRRSQSLAEIKLALEELKEESESATSASATTAAATARRWKYYGVAAALVCVLAGAGIRYQKWREQPQAVAPVIAPTQDRIAILPLQVVGTDVNAAATADGLFEILSSALSGFEQPGGKIMAVPASEIRRRGIITAEEARRLYGANLALTGKIERVGKSLRVTLNLIDTLHSRQVDSRTFAFDPASALASRNSAVEQIANLLNLNFTAAAQRELAAGDSPAPAAFTLYLEGRGLGSASSR